MSHPTTDRIRALIDAMHAINGHGLTVAEAAQVLQRVDAAHAAAVDAEKRRQQVAEFMRREAGYHVA